MDRKEREDHYFQIFWYFQDHFFFYFIFKKKISKKNELTCKVNRKFKNQEKADLIDRFNTHKSNY